MRWWEERDFVGLAIGSSTQSEVNRCLSLSRQYLSAFRTATLYDKATAFCCHPSSKSVGALSLDNTWLKGTLHRFNPT